MGLFQSAEHKCTLLCMTCGLSLLVAGGVFFLISAGLPDATWTVLGAVGLALGLIFLTTGILYWLCTIGQWKAAVNRTTNGATADETETFNMYTSEMV